jgi:26S proteasome regulatory subunit N2
MLTPSFAPAEGGSLFALGLIHANHGDDVIDYLVSQLHQESTPDPQHREILQHGAALGLGCAAMATENMEVLCIMRFKPRA